MTVENALIVRFRLGRTLTGAAEKHGESFVLIIDADGAEYSCFPGETVLELSPGSRTLRCTVENRDRRGRLHRLEAGTLSFRHPADPVNGITEVTLNLYFWNREKLDLAVGDVPPDPARERQEGCYIATCVYGSYDCPPVRTLRRFRDERLLPTAAGRCFVRFYYAVSPAAVRLFGRRRLFRAVCRRILDPIVARLEKSQK